MSRDVLGLVLRRYKVRDWMDVGRLMELRLMLDFSGSTRGYAFALFEDSKTARRACDVLDGFEIRPGHKIGVVKSIDNCRLFFGGVPKNKTKMEFLEELTKMLEGIVDVYLYPNAQDRSLNRGFIFVEFKDHRSAAMARRKLIPGRVVLWDHEIAVDWADPEPGDPVDDELMETVTALFIRNLALDTPQQQVKDVLQKVTRIPVLKLKKINHFAFVHYETRELAERVLHILTQSGSVAEKYEWEIRWAKPIGTIKSTERQRCINEAVAKHDDKANGKQRMKRKHLKNKESKNQECIIDSVNLPYPTILDYLVMEKLQANCYFELLHSSDPVGYVCRVLVVKEHLIQFEYYGHIMPSKQEAVDATIVSAYEKLCFQLCNPNPVVINIPTTLPNTYKDEPIEPLQCNIQSMWQRTIY